LLAEAAVATPIDQPESDVTDWPPAGLTVPHCRTASPSRRLAKPGHPLAGLARGRCGDKCGSVLRVRPGDSPASERGSGHGRARRRTRPASSLPARARVPATLQGLVFPSNGSASAASRARRFAHQTLLHRHTTRSEPLRLSPAPTVTPGRKPRAPRRAPPRRASRPRRRASPWSLAIRCPTASRPAKQG